MWPLNAGEPIVARAVFRLDEKIANIPHTGRETAFQCAKTLTRVSRIRGHDDIRKVFFERLLQALECLAGCINPDFLHNFRSQRVRVWRFYSWLTTASSSPRICEGNPLAFGLESNRWLKRIELWVCNPRLTSSRPLLTDGSGESPSREYCREDVIHSSVIQSNRPPEVSMPENQEMLRQSLLADLTALRENLDKTWAIVQ